MAVSSSPLLSHSPIEHYLHQLHARYAALDDGRVADYIPELAKALPDWFGICIATRDGHIYEVLLEGMVKVACVDRSAFRPARIPEFVMRAFETGI